MPVIGNHSEQPSTLFPVLAEKLALIDQRAMSLPELHGYLSALVAAPDLVPPGLWTPFIFNEDGIAPRVDDELLTAVRKEAVECYNLVSRAINEGTFEPLSGTPNAADSDPDDLMKRWAEGFFKGTALWETVVPVAEDRELTSMLLPIAYCIDAEAIAADVQDYTSTADFLSDDTRESMYGMIPAAVLMIRDYFQNLKDLHASPAEAMLPFDVSVDQEDEWDYPCPCGSGEAFGDCCGRME
ncbi:UPF0149 family protein [bacterium]|nr:UPF0149 family protein [bacterium]